MKNILKVHEDAITVPETMDTLFREYQTMGYIAEKISSMNFKLNFPDGWIHIFWEKGCIYQEIFEEMIA